MNKIAFVILNYKTYKDTIELLKNLSKQIWFTKIKIYVVDNGSNNESCEELKKFQKIIKFKLIESKVNLGFANGNNLGIQKAKEDGCEFIICSNSDIIIPFQNNFIDKIFKIYKKDDKIGIIAPSIKNLDGIYQNPFRQIRFNNKEIIKMKLFYLTGFYKIYYFLRIYVFYDLITKLSKKRRKNVKNNTFLHGSSYIYAPHGSFIIFTPSFFKYYNGFDNGTFLYCEEFILAEMLKNKNLKCWFENSIIVIHKESKSLDNITKNYKEKVKFTLKNTFESCKYFTKIIRKS
jgi:GT2 family glycosyltransferase